MPRGRGATRPDRGSVSRDGIHPIEKNGEARRKHAAKVGVLGMKVKLSPTAGKYLLCLDSSCGQAATARRRHMPADLQRIVSADETIQGHFPPA